MSETAIDTIKAIAANADRIEREKNGKALTSDEVRTVRAAAFLRAIAPYVWGTPEPPQ